MIVSMKTVLDIAESKNMAIGAFNVAELEGIQAVLEAAEELQQPVIMQFAPVHEEYISLQIFGPVMILLAEKSSIPVAVHLDHCGDMSMIRDALEIGFSSVMYDGSLLPLEENIANTKLVVEVAKSYGASVEAELGIMNSEEGENMDSSYTDPDEAKIFVDATDVDALACSFGTVHGLYKAKPELDFERIKKIYEKIQRPVVMHGGSGVSDEDMKKCIQNGVRKINYYTYRAKAGGEYVREKCIHTQGVVYFHDIMRWGRERMKTDVKHAMEVFTNR